MLNRFCGMRLSTFGVVLGWLGIVGSFISAIILAVVLGNADAIAQWIAQKMNEGQNNIEEANVRYAVLIIGSVYLALSVISLIASALLVYGTIKERHLFLVPWLINSGIGLFFSTVYQVATILMLIGSPQSFGEIILPLLITVAVLIIQYFIYYAILSLFKQIRSNSDLQRQPLQPATGPAYPSYTKI